MTTFIIVLIIIVSVLLVLLVLAQDSKGGGLTGNVGAASQIMGTRRATDWIEKATWGFVIALFVFSLGVNATIDKNVGENFTSPNIERAKSEGAPASGLNLPEVSEDENADAIESTETDDLLPAVENDSVQ